jgi:hypothetical protein
MELNESGRNFRHADGRFETAVIFAKPAYECALDAAAREMVSSHVAWPSACVLVGIVGV